MMKIMNMKKKSKNSNDKLNDKEKTERGNTKRKKYENKKGNKEKGYGNDGEDDDFDEKKIEKMSSSGKSSLNYAFRAGLKQNYDLNTLNSKFGFDQTKYSKFSRISKFSKSSNQSKKSYYLDKDKTKANLISLQKFHDHSKKVNIDKYLPTKEEENKKALDEYTRLSVSPYQFFKYNLRTRHILIAPFLNLTLFNNRWKKLIVLLTQFYIQQLALSVILTAREDIIISNLPGMIIASLLAGIISNILVYSFVFLFRTDSYERIKLFRLVLTGEDLYIFKCWSELKRIMDIKAIFGILICVIFWLGNFYITLIFTAVWKVQRIPWIICCFLTMFLDLVVGEICVEGICALLFLNRFKFNFIRNLGNSFNNLRKYRTMWP